MAHKPRLANGQLLKLLDQGLTYQQIAKRYGVTKQAIGKRAAKLKGKVAVASIVRTATNEVADSRSIDVMTQLCELYGKTNTLVTKIEGSVDDPELTLKDFAELRMQLKLAGDLMAKIFDVKAVVEFQKAVLAAIGRAAPDVQREIINELQHEHTIRSVTRWRLQTDRNPAGDE
jgi:hypothetical protein